jgi:hypothetical protein
MVMLLLTMMVYVAASFLSLMVVRLIPPNPVEFPDFEGGEREMQAQKSVGSNNGMTCLQTVEA